MMIPVSCHLWINDNLRVEDLYVNFERVKSYEEDSHLIRRLLRCKQCNQLYFYEFVEFVDFADGNDPQYVTYVPVETVEQADRLGEEDKFYLLKYVPQMRIDFSKDSSRPSIRWIGR